MIDQYAIEFALIGKLIGLPIERDLRYGLDDLRTPANHYRHPTMWKHLIRVRAETGRWFLMCWNFADEYQRRGRMSEDATFDSFAELIAALRDPEFRIRFDFPPLVETGDE